MGDTPTPILLMLSGAISTLFTVVVWLAKSIITTQQKRIETLESRDRETMTMQIEFTKTINANTEALKELRVVVERALEGLRR